MMGEQRAERREKRTEEEESENLREGETERTGRGWLGGVSGSRKGQKVGLKAV